MTTAEIDHPVAETDEAGGQEPVSAAEKGTAALFKWSQYIHVGEGAEDCEHGEDGKCSDPGHFHAWVRLPNPFQMRDITEKALAAKAQRIRVLKDPESDARIIMEEELDTLRESALKDILIDEIIDKDFQQIYVEAVREVDEIDADIPELESEDDPDAEPAKKYATIDQDREEYQRRKALPEDQRGDDFEALEQHVADHSRDVEARREHIIKAKREPLESRSMDELVEIVRRDRIEMQSAEAYLNAFNTWQWFVCCYKPTARGRPSERSFSSYNAMKYEADTPVIEALREAFDDLRSRLAYSRAVKKS